MKLYRFSPIQDREELTEALKYVVVQGSRLSEEIIGKVFPIESATIFSHYQNEYEHLVEILRGMGREHDVVNGLRVVLHDPIKIDSHTITQFRVRPPDPYRTQVGCNDFHVDDYDGFERKHVGLHPHNLRLIQRQDYEMIEFFDPDYDVLAYVLSGSI